MAAAPVSELAPTVGRYVLHGEIASGGMATVHFGRLQGAAGFARSVAIKRLHPQFAKDPDFVAMFVDEARLAARIAHPNVVPTLDVVSQEDELLLVMEYVRGSSLSRLLRTLTQRGERVPPRIAAAVISGVLHGLHAAHEAKSETGERLDIVHRDVSPQNVLVGTDGVARVLDFGVAKAAGRWQSTQQGQLKGKIAYMAPEQITTGRVTRRTDVYAAAVVLWETLTGKRLFRADNEAKLLSMVLDGAVSPPSAVVVELPRGFDPIVLRGLDRDATKRFATARDMASEVEAVIGTASPAEVGEWVERVAADELRERAHRIEEIERSIPSSPSRSIARPARAQPPEPPASTQRLRSQPQGDATGSAEPPSQGSRKTWVRISVGATVAFCAFAALLVGLRGRGAKTDAPAIASVPTAPTAGAIGSGSVAATTTATSGWIPLPTTTPISTWASLPTATSTAAPTPPPTRPAKPSGYARSPTSGAPRPDCNPPYTADAKGHIHFKPACVN